MNPYVYGDTHTRLYTYLKVIFFNFFRIKTNYDMICLKVDVLINIIFLWLQTEKLACFNTRCPGFIHINTAIPLDGDLPGSTYGGPIYDVPMYIALVSVHLPLFFKVFHSVSVIRFGVLTNLDLRYVELIKKRNTLYQNSFHNFCLVSFWG